MDSCLKNELKYVNRIRGQMNENKLMLCYKGEMSQEIVIALLNLAENKIKQTTSDLTIKSRVFSVMVECLQNITQHSEKSEYSGSNMFMIGYSDHGFNIYSGNVIRKENVDLLKDKILEINAKSEEDLKNLYKNVITNELISDDPGFGLGLIYLARKTGNALDFNFQQIDNDHFFFSLNTLVDH